VIFIAHHNFKAYFPAFVKISEITMLVVCRFQQMFLTMGKALRYILQNVK